MKEIIFVRDRKSSNNKLHFRLADSLWEELFHAIAFLAESGNDQQVRFWNVKEKERGKMIRKKKGGITEKFYDR